MRYAQLVIGPAGSGKSTYCTAISEYATTCNRVINVVNLDPAAEHFNYNPLVDIRELIHLDDAMEDQDLRFGPNGGLIFCLEFLMKNSDWLREELGDDDDDYVLFDCPGQIELYTHMSVMKDLGDLLQKWGFRTCAVFLIDAQYMIDGSKFISGMMAALSVMVNLELPHYNILSKMDLLPKEQRKMLSGFLDPDTHSLLASMDSSLKWNNKYEKLTEAIAHIVEDYSLVRFHPFSVKSERKLNEALLMIDNILQYGEDADVKTRDFDYDDGEVNQDILS